MKKELLMMGMLVLSGVSSAQTDLLWSRRSKESSSSVYENMKNINDPRIFHLDINGLKMYWQKLQKEPQKNHRLLFLFPIHLERWNISL